MDLTTRQEKYVQGLIQGKSQREAFREAYPSSKNWTDNAVDVRASQTLAIDKVSIRYKELLSRLEDEAIITAKDVLKRWRDIAYADPNEIIHHRRVCCRYCFGIDHAYQWTDGAEYERTIQQIKEAAKEDESPELPSDEGGYGFDETIRPHPKCPKCKGEGHGQVYAADTRDLSPEGKALYAGVKQTNTGFEILMKSQDKALENIAKHLGMFVEKHEHTGPGGGPLEIAQLTAEERQQRIDDLLKRREVK